jgi:hypothetical protein
MLTWVDDYQVARYVLNGSNDHDDPDQFSDAS